MSYNIKKICKERGMTVKQLAEEAGIGKSTLTNVYYRIKPMSKKVKQKLSDYLGINKKGPFKADNYRY